MMNRSDFFKSLLGVGALAIAPSSLAQLANQYEKVYLKQCFVRGFQYYDGPKRIDEINMSGMVELVREPNNKFDKRAIAVYFNGFKIGYLPRESNKTLSILMDTQLLEFHAEISHIEKMAMDWEKINMVVYALKEIKNSTDLAKIKPYQALHTPTYYTLKTTDDNIVVKIEKHQGQKYIDSQMKSFPQDTSLYLEDDFTTEQTEYTQ